MFLTMHDDTAFGGEPPRSSATCSAARPERRFPIRMGPGRRRGARIPSRMGAADGNGADVERPVRRPGTGCRPDQRDRLIKFARGPHPVALLPFVDYQAYSPHRFLQFNFLPAMTISQSILDKLAKYDTPTICN